MPLVAGRGITLHVRRGTSESHIVGLCDIIGSIEGVVGRLHIQEMLLVLHRSDGMLLMLRCNCAKRWMKSGWMIDEVGGT